MTRTEQTPSADKHRDLQKLEWRLFCPLIYRAKNVYFGEKHSWMNFYSFCVINTIFANSFSLNQLINSSANCFSSTHLYSHAFLEYFCYFLLLFLFQFYFVVSLLIILLLLWSSFVLKNALWTYLWYTIITATIPSAQITLFTSLACSPCCCHMSVSLLWAFYVT